MLSERKKEKKEILVSNIKLIIKIPMNKSSTSNQPKKINKTLIFYDSARNKMSRHLQTKTCVKYCLP